MPTDKTENTSAVTLTDNAAKKIFSLIQEEEDFDLKLRIYISGGGCSGFQYNFTFDKEVNADDYHIQKQLNTTTVSLLVDVASYQYLKGSMIDYEEKLGSSQFIIKNPNATGTCGCGNSFDAAV